MKRNILITIALLLVSILFTISLAVVDVQPVGLLGTNLGFAGFNTSVAALIGSNLSLYTASSLLGYIVLVFVALFVCYALYQLISRKSFSALDSELILLGGFFLVVGLIYIIFTKISLNYRPIFIDGAMEYSFPSSHVLLALTVPLASIMVLQFHFRAKSYRTFVTAVSIFAIVLSVAVVVLRTLSGVHWATDIIGSFLYAGTLLMALYTGLKALRPRQKKHIRAQRLSGLTPGERNARREAERARSSKSATALHGRGAVTKNTETRPASTAKPAPATSKSPVSRTPASRPSAPKPSASELPAARTAISRPSAPEPPAPEVKIKPRRRIIQ